METNPILFAGTTKIRRQEGIRMLNQGLAHEHVGKRKIPPCDGVFIACLPDRLFRNGSIQKGDARKEELGKQNPSRHCMLLPTVELTSAPSLILVLQ